MVLREDKCRSGVHLLEANGFLPLRKEKHNKDASDAEGIKTKDITKWKSQSTEQDENYQICNDIKNN